MKRQHVLLVEDEPHIASGIVFNLEEEGYRVSHVSTGEEALQQLWRTRIDLVILDLMLPGISGLEVCRQIRERDSRLPVLMLTARGAEKDRVQGLALGADDYLSKPFNLEEFLLRVRGMLRRSEWYRRNEGRGRYRFGGNEIDCEEYQANTRQGSIALTEQEAKLLQVFIAREGEVLSRTELLEAAWGVSPDTETRTLDNFVVRLRRYFEADPSHPQHFRTVRGRGYRFVQEATDHE